jgi:hypothetical protein
MKPTLLLLTALLLAPIEAFPEPIRLHPQNLRVFEYRGKPLVLITAREHYGAVMNRPFRWEPYLDDLVDKRMTVSRLFVLYRELQTAVNPYSTCKPETLDFTIQNHLETGTPEAQQHLRTWLKHLSTFVKSLDLAQAQPLPQMVKTAPEHVITSVLGVESQEYAIYLADAREVTDVGLGDPIHGDLIVTLPEGNWQAAFIHPVTGLSTDGPSIQGGEARLQLPEFRHNLAITLRRR